MQRDRRRRAGGDAQNPPANETGGAYYRKFILEDLKPWAEGGITKARPGRIHAFVKAQPSMRLNVAIHELIGLHPDETQLDAARDASGHWGVQENVIP